MQTQDYIATSFLSHALLPQGRLRKLRKEFLLRVSKINLPLYREMSKSATLLSKREIEILAHLARGKNNAAIANDLNLSVHTISNHRKNMLSSSRCSTTAELVRIATIENLI